MASVIVLLTLFALSVSAYDYDDDRKVYMRVQRASTGVYSGHVNGQHYGGTYYTPDNGPTIHQRFGDSEQGHSGGGRNKPSTSTRFNDEPSTSYNHNRPSGSGGSSFSGASAGGYAGNSYYPFQGPDVQPFKTPFEFYDFLQNFFSIYNNNLAMTFQKNSELQRNAYLAAMQAFADAAQTRFGGAPNINYGPYPGGAGVGVGAFSSASHGPSGGYLAAGVYPENPSKPNIHTRFGGEEVRPPSRPGDKHFSGISTSSFASTSDVGGKKTAHKQATTTINDNGKITSYSVEH